MPPRFTPRTEIEGVIAAQPRNPGGNLIVMPNIFNRRNRDLIIALAARYGVPGDLLQSLFAESGGLSYSDDFAEEFRQAAGYIDRILILASLFASATQSREALKTKRRGAPVLVLPLLKMRRSLG